MEIITLDHRVAGSWNVEIEGLGKSWLENGNTPIPIKNMLSEARGILQVKTAIETGQGNSRRVMAIDQHYQLIEVDADQGTIKARIIDSSV